MARNLLVINCDIRDTRVCLIEDGVIAELHLERAAQRSSVGNIVLGRVTRVLPGMQAAFIDLGAERAAFLHVEDLIRPDDFEGYLDKEDRRQDVSMAKGEGSPRISPRPTAEDIDPVDAELGAVAQAERIALDAAEDDEDDEETSEQIRSAASGSLNDADLDQTDPDDSTFDDPGPHEEGDGVAQQQPESPSDPQENPSDPDNSAPVEAEESGPDFAAASAESASNIQDVAEVEADGDLATAERLTRRAVTATSAEQRNGRRRRRRRRGGEPEGSGTTGAKTSGEVQARGKSRSPRGSGGNGGQRSNAAGDKEGARDREAGKDRRGSKFGVSRVSRSVPITDIVREGDEVVVQISKEPIGTKGARVTSHVALPGRHVVYLPTVDHIGISRRIGSLKERQRLRKVIDALKPESGGLIVRTMAEGLTKKNLKTDIGYLIGLWKEISHRRASAKAPAVLYSELDLVLKTARDLFTDDVEKIIIDDREQHARLVRFVEMFLPGRAKDIELYSGDEPIFDAYGIEDEIGRALGRKVPLPSGGYLVIDQAEALTAIDVNTGRYVGKGSKDLEETALKTNLEAVNEIAYQLRLRNIGGLVILDLIDMDQASNRDKVWRALETHLAKDKAKTTINRISELGLIEMTRKRTRESLMRMLHEPCFYCDGTGQIQSRTTVAYEILRQIRRERRSLPGYCIVVNAHPAVIDMLQTEEKEAVSEAERRYMRRIELNPRREYHLEQFDLQGR